MNVQLENDLEENRKLICECLKMEIELKRLKREWRLKMKKNLKVKQHNRLLNNKLVVLRRLSLKDGNYQKVIEMKECQVVVENEKKSRENELKITRKQTSFKVQVSSKNNVLKYPYSGCGKTFTNKSTFRNHKVTHTTKFQYHFCQKCLSKPHRLQIHLRVHTGERPFVCDWIGCGKRFKTKSSLKRHVNLKHFNKRQFQNGLSKSSAKDSLDNQQSQVAKIFKCQHPGCDSRYTNEQTLKCHTNIHTAKHQCQFCQLNCKTAAELVIHLRVHTGERPFVCESDGCGKRFAQQSTLSRHIEAKHELKESQIVEFKCDWLGCGKKFKMKNLMNVHIKREHSNERLFYCNRNGCGRSFKTKHCLQKHLKAHSSV